MMTRARSLAALAALIFVACVYLLGQTIKPSHAQDVGFRGRCWTAWPPPPNLMTNTAASVQVQVIALPPTQ